MKITIIYTVRELRETALEKVYIYIRRSLSLSLSLSLYVDVFCIFVYTCLQK